MGVVFLIRSDLLQLKMPILERVRIQPKSLNSETRNIATLSKWSGSPLTIGHPLPFSHTRLAQNFASTHLGQGEAL